MKKVTLTLSAMALLTLASCDTKECRCYEYNGSRWIRTTTTTFASTKCSDLNTSTYVCDEISDPVIDPNGIGEDYKKK